MGRPQPQYSEEQVSELNSAISSCKNALQRRKLLIIRARAVDKSKTTQISQEFGVSMSTVTHVLSQYNRHGIASTINKCGGNRRNLSEKAEDDLLQRFSEQSQNGQLYVVADIKKAYESLLGRSVPNSTIYAMLARKKWKKEKLRFPCSNKPQDEMLEA